MHGLWIIGLTRLECMGLGSSIIILWYAKRDKMLSVSIVLVSYHLLLEKQTSHCSEVTRKITLIFERRAQRAQPDLRNSETMCAE